MQYEHEGVEIAIQYMYSKHSQLIAESISGNGFFVHLVVWSRHALNSIVTNRAKQLKNLQNCRMRNTLHVMQRTIKYQQLMDYNTTVVNSR